MVGRRNRTFVFDHNKDKPHASETNGKPKDNDLESGPVMSNGNGKKPDLFKFKDIADTAIEDRRKEELKKQLLDGLSQVDLERFRKSDQDVCTSCSLSTAGHALADLDRQSSKRSRTKR